METIASESISPHHNLQPPFHFTSNVSYLVDFKGLKIREIRELIRDHLLPVSGIKEALVKRLVAASAIQSPGDDEVKQKEKGNSAVIIY